MNIPKTGNKQADTILIFAIVAAVVYLLYKLSKIAGGVATAADTIVTNVNDWLEGDTDSYNPDGLVVDYKKTSYPEWQFKAWADALEAALWSNFGEDEQPIKDIMYQINSDEDLKAIIKAYGIRTSALGISGGNLISSLRQYTPELIEGFNSHYAGFNMRGRI
jgi:hypothetical protein